jgi:putative nucleotidyltransferase with HDIG domain
MELRTETELTRETECLRAELARRERREAADNKRQLERYATDLRETFKEERERTQQLTRSYMATVRALSNAVEARDAYTGKHAERVAAYGIEIARAVGLPRPEGAETQFGFLLHDIGKVAMPDAILFKPGALTTEERALMARHPVVGAEIVDGVEFLSEAAKVVRSHDRPYRPRLPLADARAMIVEASGTHFDPMVVKAFAQIDDATIQRIGEDVWASEVANR